MGATGHFIVLNPILKHLIQRNQLLAFQFISGAHDSENLTVEFLKILNELQITDKIGQITMDNVSNNNTMMVALE